MIPVQIRAEVQILPVELLEGRGNFQREPHDLVGDQLPFEVRTRIGPVVDDARGVLPVVTVRRAMIARVRVMEHLHRDSLDGVGALDCGQVDELAAGNLLHGAFHHPAAIMPPAARSIRKIVLAIGDGPGRRFRQGLLGLSYREHQVPRQQDRASHSTY